MKRFYISDEHVRGEKRVWYVMERVDPTRPKYDRLVLNSLRLTPKAAQRRADFLNAEHEAKGDT